MIIETLILCTPCVKTQAYRMHYSDTVSGLNSAFDSPRLLFLHIGPIIYFLRSGFVRDVPCTCAVSWCWYLSWYLVLVPKHHPSIIHISSKYHPHIIQIASKTSSKHHKNNNNTK